MRWRPFSKLSSPRRRDLLAMLALSVLVLGQWAYFQGFTREQPVLAPMSYRGDAWFTAAGVTAARRGEYLPFVSKDIPSLGAPSGANWADFPIHEDLLIFFTGTLARVTGVFGAINLGLGLAVLLAALTMFAAARRFHLSRPGALLAGHLFGLSTFLQMRGVHHFALTFYFFFPALIVISAWLTSRKGVALKSKRMKAAGLVVLTAAWSTIYFVYFAAQILGASALASWVKFGLQRWRVWLVLAAVGALASLSMQLDSLVYWQRHGRNLASVNRDPRDVEMQALKPVNFVAPSLGGQGKLRGKLGQAARAEAVTEGEIPSPYFGVIGVAAWLGLIGVSLVRLVRGQRGLPVTWGLMAWLVTSLNTVGGLSSLSGLFGLTAFRAVNRASIVVFAYVLLFLAWAFPRVTRRLPVPARWALAIALALFGGWEQGWGAVKMSIDADHLALFESDKALVATAEQQLPSGARIFCLPAAHFPEHWEQGLDNYELFRPYFFAKDFVFSHGDVKGRASGQFKYDVSKLPPPEMFDTLRENGFDAIYINLRPYGGVSGLAPFEQAGATVVALSSLEDSAFLRLPER